MSRSFNQICDETLSSKVVRFVSSIFSFPSNYNRREAVLNAIQKVHVLAQTNNPTSLQREIDGCFNALFYLQATTNKQHELEQIFKLQMGLTTTLALQQADHTLSLGTPTIISQIGEIYASDPEHRPTLDQIRVIVDFQKATGANNPLSDAQIKQLVLFMNTPDTCYSILKQPEFSWNDVKEMLPSCNDKTTCTDLLKLFVKNALEAKASNLRLLQENNGTYIYHGLKPIQEMTAVQSDLTRVVFQLTSLDRDTQEIITVAKKISDESVLPNTQINMDGWMNVLGKAHSKGTAVRQASNKKAAEADYVQKRDQILQQIQECELLPGSPEKGELLTKLEKALNEIEALRGFIPRSESLMQKVGWENDQGEPIGQRGILLGPDDKPIQEPLPSQKQLFTAGVRHVQFRHNATQELVSAKARLDLTPLGDGLTDDQCIQAFEFISKFQALIDDYKPEQGDPPLAEWVSHAMQAKREGERGALPSLAYMDNIDPRVQNIAEEMNEFSPEQQKMLIDIALSYTYEINHSIEQALAKLTK